MYYRIKADEPDGKNDAVCRKWRTSLRGANPLVIRKRYVAEI